MKEHIYILDDHPMIAEGTAQLLMTDERYQVTIGKHYSELYNFIESNPISLLIIDYELQDKTAAILTKENTSDTCACIYYAYGVLDNKTANKKRSSRYSFQK